MSLAPLFDKLLDRLFEILNTYLFHQREYLFPDLQAGADFRFLVKDPVNRAAQVTFDSEKIVTTDLIMLTYFLSADKKTLGETLLGQIDITAGCNASDLKLMTDCP